MFNKKKQPSQTPKNEYTIIPTHENGIGYSRGSKLDLLAILANNLDTKFYDEDRINRLIVLVNAIATNDLEFLLKTAIYVRKVLGLRSPSILLAAYLSKFLSGNPKASKFYSRDGVVHRLDDILEIYSAYKMLGGKSFPSSMKKGFASVLTKSDRYQLAKYKNLGKEISLIDMINLVHPKPNPEMQEVFQSLMKGTLPQINTSENLNTESGKHISDKIKSGEINSVEAEEMLKDMKGENYHHLLSNNKMGYLAIIRNLTQMLETKPDVEFIQLLTKRISNKDAILGSKTLPHQIDLALERVLLSSNPNTQVIKALNEAYELAIPNLEGVFKGNTAVIFDTSGSMTNGCSVFGKSSKSSAISKAALIAATLAKGIGADVYHFASYCDKIPYNQGDSVNTLKRQFELKSGTCGHGTEFNEIFKTVPTGVYDRMFIISDMQGASNLKMHGHNSYIYSIDVTGYQSSTILPNSRVVQLFGYSSDIYEMANKVELDVSSLLLEIEKITI